MEENQKKNAETNLFKRAWCEVKNFGLFLRENPQYLFHLTSGIVGGAMTIAGLVNRFGGSENICEVPDEITGLNYRTSHALTNTEIMELSDRMIDGETTGEALLNMGLLKKEKRRK